MRGASALGGKLAAHPRASVRVIVIWEPVIPTDVGPPTDEVRRPLGDPRVVELWDPGRWMSPRAIARATMTAKAKGEPPPEPGTIAWDLVAVFPPGATWEEPFPTPSALGYPVVDSLGLLEETLAAASAPRE